MPVYRLTVEIGRCEVHKEGERQTLSRLLVVNKAIVVTYRLVGMQVIAEVGKGHRDEVGIIEVHAVAKFSTEECSALILRTEIGRKCLDIGIDAVGNGTVIKRDNRVGKG